MSGWTIGVPDPAGAGWRPMAFRHIGRRWHAVERVFGIPKAGHACIKDQHERDNGKAAPSGRLKHDFSSVPLTPVLQHQPIFVKIYSSL
jgi:hypothetical protein